MVLLIYVHNWLSHRSFPAMALKVGVDAPHVGAGQCHGIGH